MFRPPLRTTVESPITRKYVLIFIHWLSFITLQELNGIVECKCYLGHLNVCKSAAISECIKATNWGKKHGCLHESVLCVQGFMMHVHTQSCMYSPML